MARFQLLFSSTFMVVFSFSKDVSCTPFTFTNNCGYTVWPGILSNAGTSPLTTTGFSLVKGQTVTIDAPANWSGRLWGRTLCATDATGNFVCGTGDCGSGKVECSGGASPPATLAEFTLAGSGGNDFYDVSLVDGYNLPMLVVPQGSNCSSTGCIADLNAACPSDLRVMMSSESVACKSACEAYGSPQYCCSGEYGNPNTCKPSSYSQFFKNECPRAYSYAYDDATSTFTCATGGGYTITFCPATTRKKVGNNPETSAGPAGLPLVNETMVFLSGQDQYGEASKGLRRTVPLLSVLTWGSNWRLDVTWFQRRQLCSDGRGGIIEGAAAGPRRRFCRTRRAWVTKDSLVR